jgi:arylsulfatase A-like enzyme/Flp pilus assembly protein TadD
MSVQQTHYALRITHYILILLLLPIACKKDTEPPKSKPHLILISIDTLRSDYLKLYDTKGISTPNMEDFAREGVTFRNVISQVPYTLPSHATMLTGMYPAAHRVRDNVRDVLPSAIPTLAEIFKKNGYQTAGFAGSMVLSQQTGIARGFDYYDDFFSRGDVHAEDLGGIERKAGVVVQSFEYWLDHRQSQNPFFAFIHFYDPHSPYTPPAGYSVTNKLEDLYAGEIKYVDFVLGKLFETLKKKNVWNNAAIMITSDHGEMLNEHGELGHGFFLYKPALAVPLLLRAPGLRTHSSVEDLVEIADFAPTLLEVAGIQPPSQMQGESLIPLSKEGRKKKNRAAYAESYFASLQFGISPLKMVQDGNLKYIEAPHPEFYDLASDPNERSNLAEDRKSDIQKFRTRLIQFEKVTARDYTKEQRKVTAEEAEQFAAIGYLGGQIPENKWDLKKDPKDFIDEWQSTLEVTALVDQGQCKKVLPMIQEIANKAIPSSSLLLLQSKCYASLGDLSKAEEVLKPISDTPEALTTLAQINSDAGKKARAEQLYSKALEKQFSYFTVYNYVLLLREAGQKEKALSYLENLRTSRKDGERSLPFFAEMYIALENWLAAESTLVQLIKNRPWESKWYRDLAVVYQAQGKLQNALELLSANQDQFKDDPEYQLRLGIVLNRTGQKSNEIALFQQFTQKWPADSRGYFYLAKGLLDANQDPATIAGLAQKGLALEPDAEMTIFGYFLLGNAYERMGKTQEAQRAFETAERLEKRTS